MERYLKALMSGFCVLFWFFVTAKLLGVLWGFRAMDRWETVGWCIYLIITTPGVFMFAGKLLQGKV